MNQHEKQTQTSTTDWIILHTHFFDKRAKHIGDSENKKKILTKSKHNNNTEREAMLGHTFYQ